MIACQCQFNIVIKVNSHNSNSRNINSCKRDEQNRCEKCFHMRDGISWFTADTVTLSTSHLCCSLNFRCLLSSVSYEWDEEKYYIFHGLWFLQVYLLVVVVSKNTHFLVIVVRCSSIKWKIRTKVDKEKRRGKWFFFVPCKSAYLTDYKAILIFYFLFTLSSPFFCYSQEGNVQHHSTLLCNQKK